MSNGLLNKPHQIKKFATCAIGILAFSLMNMLMKKMGGCDPIICDIDPDLQVTILHPVDEETMLE